ncbi:hypothetical protein PBY51_005390 [Eleginops maclovinus]|uniref:Uncharacterized protein n=1 Tax=Eleginops maclovinus TaxID=56733 RepID=A0AAN7X4B0_ELEMC|nr:hypothetical protein PBY51_005390 [Eleginops maclovinus]
MRRAEERKQHFYLPRKRVYLWRVFLRSCQRGGSKEVEEEKIPPLPPGYREMKDGETKGCAVSFGEDYVRAVEAEEEP